MKIPQMKLYRIARFRVLRIFEHVPYPVIAIFNFAQHRNYLRTTQELISRLIIISTRHFETTRYEAQKNNYYYKN